MPGRDGTGPMGLGPMTGRGAGYCGGRVAVQGAGRGLGLGFRGAGRGGYGRRNMFYATGLTGWQRAAQAAAPAQVAEQSPPDAEKQLLRQQVEAMQLQLDAMKKRLAEINPQQT